MFRPTSKKQIPAEMIKALRTGPSSLSGREAQQILAVHAGTSIVQAEAVRAVLQKNYSLWLETWIIPELERLLPRKQPTAAPQEATIEAYAIQRDADQKYYAGYYQGHAMFTEHAKHAFHYTTQAQVSRALQSFAPTEHWPMRSVTMQVPANKFDRS